MIDLSPDAMAERVEGAPSEVVAPAVAETKETTTASKKVRMVWKRILKSKRSL